MDARCPYCSTVFPTDQTGLQFCPSCGRQIHIAQLGEAPLAAAVADTATGSSEVNQREDTPWERRGELGWLKGFTETLTESVFAPDKFWRKVKPLAPASEALFFAWIVQTLNSLAMGLVYVLGGGNLITKMLLRMPNLPPGLRQSLVQALDVSLSRQLLFLVMGLVLFPLFSVITAAVLHLGCLLFGCAANGFWATFRTFCYSTGPQVASAVPYFGILAVLYSGTLQILGLTRMQNTTGVRATAAVVVIPILCLCCCGMSIIAAVGLGAAGLMRR